MPIREDPDYEGSATVRPFGSKIKHYISRKLGREVTFVMDDAALIASPSFMLKGDNLVVGLYDDPKNYFKGLRVIGAAGEFMQAMEYEYDPKSSMPLPPAPSAAIISLGKAVQDGIELEKI